MKVAVTIVQKMAINTGRTFLMALRFHRRPTSTPTFSRRLAEGMEIKANAPRTKTKNTNAMTTSARSMTKAILSKEPVSWASADAPIYSFCCIFLEKPSVSRFGIDSRKRAILAVLLHFDGTGASVRITSSMLRASRPPAQCGQSNHRSWTTTA